MTWGSSLEKQMFQAVRILWYHAFTCTATQRKGWDKGRKFPWAVSVQQHQPSPLPSLFSCLQHNVPSRVSLLCWLEAERKDHAANSSLLLKSVSHLHLCTAHRWTWHGVDWTPPTTSAHLPLYLCTSPFPGWRPLCLQSVLVSGHSLCKVLLVFLLQNSL